MTRKKLSEYDAYQWTPSKGYLEIEHVMQGYRRGLYRHKLGIAAVYMTAEATSINIIYNGISYARRWGRPLPERTISRLCREFLEDVSNGAKK